MYHWPGSGTHNIKWWLMLHMQLMMAWRVILGLWWLWAKELSMDHLHANELTLRVQLKVNLLRSMIWCLKYFGQGSHKDTKFMTHYCIKIIRECNEFWENFRGSSGKRTCHCFFTKDRIASGEVKLKYCPTDTILADAFTKPLQESAFIWFRDSIMYVSSHKNNDIKTTNVLRISDYNTSHTKSVLTQQRRQDIVEKLTQR